MARKYSKKASEEVEKAVRQQAVAIGLSEVRKKGAKVPNASSKRKSSKKKE